MSVAIKLFKSIILGLAVICVPLGFAQEIEGVATPTDTQLILDAEQYFRKGYYKKAIETLGEMVDQEKVPLFRAKILMADKQYEEAEIYYRALIADGHKYFFELGECLYEQERYKDALPVYNKAGGDESSLVWVAYKSLLCQLLLNDWLAATQTLERLPVSSSHPGFYFGQAAYRFAQNKSDEALYFVHSAEQFYDGRDVVRFLQPLFQQLWLLPDESSLKKIN